MLLITSYLARSSSVFLGAEPVKRLRVLQRELGIEVNTELLWRVWIETFLLFLLSHADHLIQRFGSEHARRQPLLKFLVVELRRQLVVLKFWTVFFLNCTITLVQSSGNIATGSPCCIWSASVDTLISACALAFFQAVVILANSRLWGIPPSARSIPKSSASVFIRPSTESSSAANVSRSAIWQ